MLVKPENKLTFFEWIIPALVTMLSFMGMGRLNTAFVLGIALVAGGLRADPLSQWTWRYPYPQGSTLRGVTYGGGQFVAVGDGGAIITSPDGYNWTVQSFNVFPGLLGVAYAAGEYAAVGNGGVILVSSNAINWTQISSPTANTLHGIAGDSAWQFDDTPQFLAAGDFGTVVQCTNGSNWSLISSGITNDLFAVALAPNRPGKPDTAFFSVVGNGGTVFTYGQSYSYLVPQNWVGVTNNLYGIAISTNGVAAACGDLNFWADVPASGGGFNVYYTNGILYSSDYGILWTNQMWGGLYGLPNVWFPSSTFILRAAASGAGGFVAVGDTGYTSANLYPGVVFTSASGTNWSETSATTSDSYLYGATYGNGEYVLVGDSGTIVVSPDLTNFTEITGCHRSAIRAIACSENLCVASASPIFHDDTPDFPDFTTIVSSNAGYWIESNTNVFSSDLASLASGGNQFVGVNSNAYGVFTTTDGYNWQYNDSISNFLNGVCYANGQFIVVGGGGTIFTSPDATNWSNHSITTAGSLSAVTYGNGMYLTAGSVAATSTDGINWSLSSTNLPAGVSEIVYGEGQFVAAAAGNILTTTDGIHWQTDFTSPAGSITGVAYTGGTFVAISEYGNMFKSSDGTNWMALPFALPMVDNGSYAGWYGGYYSTIAAFNGTFLAAGVDGILVQSGNTWNPALISVLSMASNGFAFSYTQQIDVPYHIQTSTNLVNWTSIYTGTGTGQPTNFAYSPSNNSPAQFFRLISP